MKPLAHKMELFVDRIIPFVIFVLFIIIVVELFFPQTGERYHNIITIADAAIIFIFALDLVFKYIRIRKIPKFIKTCWLDIIAIFPFFLLFRVIERVVILAEISGSIKQFQMLFHEGMEIEKETAKIFEEGGKIVQEAEKVGKTSRVKSIIRIFKPVSRSPRLVKALPFYEQPTGLHHIHDPKEDVKALEKEVKKDAEKAGKVIKKDIRAVKGEVKKEILAVEKDTKKIGKVIKKEIRAVKEKIKKY
ncbi:hypothetical protein HZB88_01805 [archaeon]|nr:hypothetical protein [archaeon]